MAIVQDSTIRRRPPGVTIMPLQHLSVKEGEMEAGRPENSWDSIHSGDIVEAVIMILKKHPTRVGGDASSYTHLD